MSFFKFFFSINISLYLGVALLLNLGERGEGLGLIFYYPPLCLSVCLSIALESYRVTLCVHVCICLWVLYQVL